MITEISILSKLENSEKNPKVEMQNCLVVCQFSHFSHKHCKLFIDKGKYFEKFPWKIGVIAAYWTSLLSSVPYSPTTAS